MIDTRYTLTHEEFLAHLESLGLHIKLSTLKRWAYEGIIERPQRYKRGKGGKKGRAVKWSLRAVEEACAVWAIRNSNITKALASKSKIEEVKREAELVYHYPNPTYSWQPLTKRPLRRNKRDSTPEVFTVQNVNEVIVKLVESDEMHHLITTWIAAIEKARHTWPVHEPAKVIFWRRGIPYKSVIQPYQSESQSGCEAGEDYSTSDESYFHVLEDITLEKATRDEIIFYVDGEDSRAHIVFVE